MADDRNHLAAPMDSGVIDASAVIRFSPLGTALPAPKKRPAGLGRGLSALLGEAEEQGGVGAGAAQRPGGGTGSGAGDGVAMIGISEIRPHPRQPRRHFDEAALAELAASIAENGVLQPILVRPAPDGQGYELVAGERRWRASQRAGKHQIPAMVRTLDDAATFTIALVENIQRADLSAIEEAEAYIRLREELGHSAEAIGRMTGKSRPHIANLLRLLELPASVQAMVADGSLGMGHARALIGAGDAEVLARKVVAEGLSVRAVEALVRQRKAPTRRGGAQGNSGGDRRGNDADIAALESHLADLLGLGVRIAHKGNGGGTLTLDYSSLDQLDMLCQRLSGEAI
jgi:ParB family transcriptional regulator, chromosome partitioning protein